MPSCHLLLWNLLPYLFKAMNLIRCVKSADLFGMDMIHSQGVESLLIQLHIVPQIGEELFIDTSGSGGGFEIADFAVEGFSPARQLPKTRQSMSC
ncbi:MAG: hypothetical protein IE889_03995 [Campylobacterales bacterium]|nr:hypothetical protein [Campylobacterales bacterium]